MTTKSCSFKKTSVVFIGLSDAEKARMLNAYTKKISGDLSRKIKELREKKNAIEAEIKRAQRAKKKISKKDKK